MKAVVNYESKSFERVFYSKNEETNTVEITSRERCYIVDINDAEKEALDSLKQQGTFAEIAQNIENNTNTISELNTEIEKYSTKVEELETQVSTLTTERDEAQSNYEAKVEELNTANASIEQKTEEYTALESTKTELDNQISELTATLNTVTAERDALATYKKDSEDAAKTSVINTYSELLDASVIESYTNNMDSYTIKELDMHLTYECKKANPAIFSKNNTEPQTSYVPKEDPAGRGINDILAKYENK